MLAFGRAEIGATGDEDFYGACYDTFDCAGQSDPTECSQGSCEQAMCRCQDAVNLHRCRCKRNSLPA
jgi:hypothetical protein